MADPRNLRFQSWSKFFHFHAVFSNNFTKQECILVGCVPFAAVAVSGGGGVSGGCLPRGGVFAWGGDGGA